MKITAPAKALDAAMSLAVMAADKQLDAPIRIVAGPGAVGFCVTNPRAVISISTTAAASIEEPGSATISARRFAALLSGFGPRSTINISTTETAVMISSGNSRYRLPLLADPRAGLVINPEIGRVELASADCIRLLDVVAAAGTEKTRFFLNGVYLHSDGDKLVGVGMDGTKVLRVGVAADHFSEDNRLIIPATAVKMLDKLLRATKPETVTLRRSRAVFAASAPGFEIVSGMIDAAYPDYRRNLPHANGSSALCQRADLLSALTRLAAIAAGEMPLIALTWVDGEPMRLFLAREPDAGIDAVAAQTCGSARMALSLAQFITLLCEFKDDALLVEMTDRGIIIRQGDKFAVLMSCLWAEREIAA
jgi:DNA polymerase III sliding clamp (beta) subunit (PCNA family)